MSILQDPRLGYYTVGEKIFYSKIQACIHATKTNQHPQWIFNDRLWQSQNWYHEPEDNILSLYRQRARQIRERYDYVILYYSGGSDSQTMVDAFLQSNSHIDEIVTLWNRSHTSKVDTSGLNFDACNVEAEFEITTRPGIDRILAASPKTKITYKDVCVSIVGELKNLTDGEWLEHTPEHLNPQILTRWAVAREKNQLLQLDHGKKTVTVLGLDKPRVCIKDGRYCVYFLDIIVNMCRGGVGRTEYDNIATELFYWTPDLPQIIVKQAHLIKKWFEHNPRLKSILTWPNSNYHKRTAYEILTRSIVYPDWDMETFQCSKPTSPIWCEWDHWFFQQYRDTSAMCSWMNGIDYVKQSVDPKYLSHNFQDQLDGFVGMINGHYDLGPADIVV